MNMILDIALYTSVIGGSVCLGVSLWAMLTKSGRKHMSDWRKRLDEYEANANK